MGLSPPPYYILISHSSLSNSSQGAPSNTLSHPAIQYHYADDSPLAVLPHHPDQHVLVLDYNPSAPSASPAKSISETLAVTALNLEEAPGAAAMEALDPKNDRMFIIQTTVNDYAASELQGGSKSAHTSLELFKRRNAVLRHALSYPNAITQPAPDLGPSNTTAS